MRRLVTFNIVAAPVDTISRCCLDYSGKGHYLALQPLAGAFPKAPPLAKQAEKPGWQSERVTAGGS